MPESGAAGGTGNSSVALGSGNDSVSIGGSGNVVVLGSGNDSVTASGNNNRVTVGNGNDTVSLTGAGNTVIAGNGNDSITGGVNSTISVGSGNDQISVGPNSVVTLGTGHDTVAFGLQFGNETINGFTSKDQIVFNHMLLASYMAVVGATSQVGPDTVIKVDANDSVTLTHFTASTLSPAIFISHDRGLIRRLHRPVARAEMMDEALQCRRARPRADAQRRVGSRYAGSEGPWISDAGNQSSG